MPEDTEVPVDLDPEAADLEAEDLTADPAEAGLATLVAEDTEDLAALAAEAERVAVEERVTAPLLVLLAEELRVPALRDTEPIPLLPAAAVVATLGL